MQIARSRSPKRANMPCSIPPRTRRFAGRLRKFEKMGFSGFERRYYSLFENLIDHVAYATNLQTLVTALAVKYVFSERVTDGQIPDEPFIESERRQIFFSSAIRVPTFYVRSDSKNFFLRRILERTNGIRYSRRYPGYLRVYNRQYRLALVDFIRTDAADLIEMFNLPSTLEDLRNRIDDGKGCSAEGRLMAGILAELGSDSPLKTTAAELNLAAERYYRTTLKKRHVQVALALIACYLFLNSSYVSALVVAAMVTQLWRAFSETLRADHRGGGTLSAYQIMAILGMLYLVMQIPLFSHDAFPRADIGLGLACLWDPAVVLFLQGLGAVIFVSTGCSNVTGSTMSFHVLRERI